MEHGSNVKASLFTSQLEAKKEPRAGGLSESPSGPWLDVDAEELLEAKAASKLNQTSTRCTLDLQWCRYA